MNPGEAFWGAFAAGGGIALFIMAIVMFIAAIIGMVERIWSAWGALIIVIVAIFCVALGSGLVGFGRAVLA